MVGHSLGTVVAYDVLAQPDPETRCSSVRNRRFASRRRADPKDSATAAVSQRHRSLVQRTRREGRPWPFCRSTEAAFPTDSPIENYTRAYETERKTPRHLGYLNDPQVAKRIYDALTAPEEGSPTA